MPPAAGSWPEPQQLAEDLADQRVLGYKEGMMYSESLVALRCRITRGGFSSERVFRVRLAEGEEYVGVAPVDYFLTEAKAPLPADEPPQRGTAITGHVAARVLSNGSDEAALVSVPSGDVLRVNAGELSSYPGGSRAHVPVQP
jgi:hypothetical protein